jgi:hypothetical protein
VPFSGTLYHFAVSQVLGVSRQLPDSPSSRLLLIDASYEDFVGAKNRERHDKKSLNFRSAAFPRGRR